MFSHYRDLIRLYWFRILMGTVIASVMAFGLSSFLLLKNPIYKSLVTMNMQPSDEALAFNRQFMGVSQFNPATIITQTHIERLLSRPVAERTLEILLAESGSPPQTEPSFFDEIKLKLWQTWTRINYGKYVELAEQDQWLNALQESIDLEFVEGSYILRLEAASEYPDLAARIANAYAQAYVEITTLETQNEASKASGTLQIRIDELDANLADLFARREAMREDLQISDIRRQNDILLATLQQKRAALNEEKLELQLLESKAKKLEVSLAGADARSSNPYNRLQLEIAEAKERIDFRDTEIFELKANVNDLARKENSFSNLSTEIAAAQLDLTELRERNLSLQLGAEFRGNQIRIVEPAKAAVYPAFPKVFVNTVVAAIVGGALVLVSAVMQDLFGSRVRTHNDLTQSSIGVILPNGSKRTARAIRRNLGKPARRWSRRTRRFIEAFGQRMGSDGAWSSNTILVTGFVTEKQLQNVEKLFQNAADLLVSRKADQKRFTARSVGPIYTVEDWDALPDGPVVIALKRDDKNMDDLNAIGTLGKVKARKPMFMIWT